MKIPLSSSLMSEEKAAKQETGCWGSKACCEAIAWKDLALPVITAWFWIQDVTDQEVLLLVKDQKAPGEPSHAFCTKKHQCPSTECKYGSANTPPFSTCSQSHLAHRVVKWIQPRMKLLLLPFYSGPQWTFFPTRVDKSGEGSALAWAADPRDCLIQDFSLWPADWAEPCRPDLLPPVSLYKHISPWRKDSPKLRIL